jgi:predicted Na+-dependent transporter
VFPIVLSRMYGGDPATAVRIVVGTSALSILTTPFWLQVGMRWLGVAR